ncbi:hypothetical protein AcV7_003206 [Taiwanofungus camphoratus]|nr:hypothetical protein AcV7_003206 [Antrodia cinnamomea]
MIFLLLQLAAIMTILPVPLNVLANQQVVFEDPIDHGSASLPVPNPTQSFWIDSPDANPLAGEGSEGPLTADADVCIIGSGITGISAAYHLGKAMAKGSDPDRPLKVTILEARDFCSGATGRNGGHLAPHAFSNFRRHAKNLGIDEALRGIAIEKHTAAEIVKIVQEHHMESAVDLVTGGRIELLFTKEEFLNAKADYEAAQAAGADLHGVEWLDEEEMKINYGASYPGVQMPAHNIWPLKFVTLLYNLTLSSSHLSLNLHTRTPVTSIAPLPPSLAPRRWNVTSPRGEITCSYVLHASNAYASYLLPHMHGPAGIIPTRGQVIALRADVSARELTRSAWLGNEGLEYWFPRPVKADTEAPLVILGGGREVANPAFELYVEDDSIVNSEVGEVLRKFLPSVFPGKFETGKEPEMEWVSGPKHSIQAHVR